MFHGATKLKDLNLLENWNVSNSKNLAFMFYGCISLSDVKFIKKMEYSKKM